MVGEDRRGSGRDAGRTQAPVRGGERPQGRVPHPPHGHAGCEEVHHHPRRGGLGFGSRAHEHRGGDRPDRARLRRPYQWVVHLQHLPQEEGGGVLAGVCLQPAVRGDRPGVREPGGRGAQEGRLHLQEGPDLRDGGRGPGHGHPGWHCRHHVHHSGDHGPVPDGHRHGGRQRSPGLGLGHRHGGQRAQGRGGPRQPGRGGHRGQQDEGAVRGVRGRHRAQARGAVEALLNVLLQEEDMKEGCATRTARPKFAHPKSISVKSGYFCF